MYIRRLTHALQATLIVALLWPAVASAGALNADLDHDKVVDNLESHIAGLPDDGEVQLIVSLERAASAGRVRSLERAVGDLDVKDRFEVVDAVALTATKDQVRELAALGVVDRVERDLPVHADAAPFPTSGSNDSAQGSFGVTEARLDAPLLDGDADGDPSAYSPDDLVAAVVDSGIDASHIDLDGGKVLAFKDFVNDPDPTDADDPNPYDDDGHGTHVAGTIAGEGNGDIRYRGVAPAAGLVGVKVLDENGDGNTSDVVAAIEWVIDHKDDYGIEVVNMSLGTDGCGDGFGSDSDAVNAAWAEGLAVMVAAGNDGPATCTVPSPGDAKDVLTVGAMADLGASGFKQADFSSRGPTADGRIKPDVSAPGVGINSVAAGSGGGYVPMNGTSMATPFVAGVALLMLDANAAYTNDEVKDTIRSTAVDWGRGGTGVTPGTTGPDVDYGAGRLDAYAALAAAGAAIDSPPAVPQHTLREGNLGATGQAVEYSVDVADTTFPVAATLVDVPTSCRAPASNPDFDMQLMAPNGAVVATAASAERQDELGYKPTATGVYKLRVQSFSDCGGYFVDVSGGAVSSGGNGDPGGGGDKDGGGSTTPPPAGTGPGATTPPFASAALVNAARVTARRATASLRRAGLRRLLRRGGVTVVGLAPSAGRVELAVRMRVRGRRVIVARGVRRVSRAGQPRLTVRLTRAGRRLLAGGGAVRLGIRAAVTDSSQRRRYADRSVRVRR